MASREDENPQEQNDPSTYQWSERFNCPIINGILAPTPVSVVVPMQTEPELEAGDQKAAELSPESGKTRGTSTTEVSEDVYFKLFKFVTDSEQYILEMHETSQEDETSFNYRCHLLVYNDNGKWNVGVYNLSQGDHVVFPITEDPNPLVFEKNTNLSLKHRLTGWKVETRTRNSGHEDKFHYHLDRQFRSFIEVAAFILYASKPKDLKLYMAAEETRMANISSADTGENLGSLTNNPGYESRETQNPEEGQPEEIESEGMAKKLSGIFEDDVQP